MSLQMLSIARTAAVLAVFAGSLAVAADFAAAKEVKMGAVARGTLKVVCDRAGGASIGIEDDQSGYGCRASRGSVSCTPDAECFGTVPDLRPVTGNSVYEVLGVTPAGGASAVRPLDARILPEADHEKTNARTVQPVTAN